MQAVNARNHPLLLLSGVGTNAIGYDLSPQVSFLTFVILLFFLQLFQLSTKRKPIGLCKVKLVRGTHSYFGIFMPTAHGWSSHIENKGYTTTRCIRVTF